MNLYRVSFFAFALALTGFFISLDVIIHSNRMPGPRLSDSVSFNQKAIWLRKALRSDSTPEVLIVGSSMGMNNVNGEELAHDLKTEALLNASSWGLEPREAAQITEILVDHLPSPPKVIIMPVCLGDFKKHGTKEIDWSSFQQCLYSPFLLPLYLKYPDRSYYLTTMREQNEPAEIERKAYDSLHFDVYGGIPLSCTDFLYTTQRWDSYQTETLDATQWDRNAIISLTQLAYSLEAKKIHLLVVACPMRPAAEQALGRRAEADVWSKVRAALAPTGATFLHITGPDYTDADFVDSYHLNECGSRKVARQVAPTIAPWLRVP